MGAGERTGVRVRVGQKEGDIVGRDHRALQAAVDYVAGLGGGVVEVGPGVYQMGDSLHLRGRVAVVGEGGTVLRKGDGFESRLAMDGDYGEEQVTVDDPSRFRVGMGIAVKDDRSGGFHTTVATILWAEGNTFGISKPLNADCMVHNNAVAQSVFPVISGYYAEGVRVEGVTIRGNRQNNPALNGCRGAGLFLYRGHGAQIRACVVEDYPGDGISFQQSNDVIVEGCVVSGCSALGLHPGSGSQRPIIRSCRSFENGQIGLFLCWRVRRGVFEGNELRGNGKTGISIGHKDSDNVFLRNVVVGNGVQGVLFRKETEPMGGHRNRFEDNRIQDNGGEVEGYGVRIDGETHDLTFVRNVIGDTRPEGAKRQRVGVSIGPSAERVALEGNDLSGNAEAEVKDERKCKVQSAK